MLSSKIKERLHQERTPLYLYDMDLLRRTLESAREASGRYGYKVHYALKANFDPVIVECIHDHGFGTDCVSGNEVRYSIECGFAPSDVVYAGVGKTDEEIEYAIRQQIFAFNCESRQEMRVINDIAAGIGMKADVAFRLNPDVDPLTHKGISTGQADSKFGISYKEIDEIAAEAGSLNNINITGIHFHIGSQITELKVFEYLCRRANTLFEYFVSRGFDLKHINLGGGLGIDYNRPEEHPIPDFETYFDIFARNLNVGKDTEVHFELGRSLVGQCGEFISRVLFTKINSAGKNVALLDGSMTELIRPALYQSHHSIENLDGAGRRESQYTIGGTVCESTDTFARGITLPELRRGDLVSIKTAGAYGSAMASRYNMHELPRALHWERQTENI
ncbi:MAG: diaminopimelate decarboxylase [Rikenellaceae bacterium]|nr:diaminopimelate decarboxylase [Rikenellaceae bacterium]